MDAPTASRTHAPASPRGNVYITLHLYLPSGEFIIADRVPLDQDVEWYVHHLEEGHVDPSLRIPDGSWSHGDVWEEWTECVHGYTLVWKDMDLEECGSKFIDFVQDHGMPVDEPVDIMVVMLSSQRANYDWMLS